MRCRRAFALLGVATWFAVVFADAAGGAVVVSLSGPTGTIGHQAVRVNQATTPATDALGVHHNSQPVLAPFMSPTGVGGRFANHPGVSPNEPFGIYAALDGAGAFSFSPTGTVRGLPSGTGSFGAPGMLLPTAAHTGVLPSDLALPGGTIAAGSTIYSDFAGLRVNLDSAADYWFDTAAGLEHRTYRGGTWSFFYQQGGSFIKFAEYVDVVELFQINWAAGTANIFWTATAIPVSDVILPASGTAFGAAVVNVAGFLDNELVSPFVSFYGQFPGQLNIAFDVENARAVPEPASAALMMIGIGLLGVRRCGRMRTSLGC